MFLTAQILDESSSENSERKKEILTKEDANDYLIATGFELMKYV